MNDANKPAEAAPNLELTSAEVERLLFRSFAEIAGQTDLDTLLLKLADLGRNLVSADRCTLWLVNEDRTEVWTKVAHGVPTLRMPMGQGFAGICAKTGETALIPNAYLDSRFNREMDVRNNYHTNSILTIPVKDADGGVVAVYQAVNKFTTQATPDGVFTELDIERLTLAAQVSVKSIEAATLHQALLKAQNDILETQREIIIRFGGAVESRSKETGNHVKRVAEYCYLLAKYNGQSVDFCDNIRMTSPMHDVGKIVIPDSVLKKPGRLTVEEFELMKTHALRGFDMFADSTLPLLKLSATIAYTHQEKWNGTGYPRGLKGEEIPLAGRICAVADVFDALANDRCYKKAWPMEKVIQLFREERGNHFDPELVDILLVHIDEFQKINEQYKDVYEDDPLEALLASPPVPVSVTP